MSAIAQYFLQKGESVFGYDLTPSPVTDMLMSKGAVVHFVPDTSLIPDNVDFVVYTPAVPTDLEEYQYFVKKNVPILKRSQVLGKITDEYCSVAVAGTHGKTTTTSLIAHLFAPEGERSCEYSQNLLAFIGGISKNLNDNYLYDTSLDCGQTVSVVEADEFDRSFLTLHPDVSVITSMDADHLDIYNDTSHLRDAFRSFAAQSRTVFVESQVSELLGQHPRKFVYGFSSYCDAYPFNVKTSTEATCFDLHTPFGDIAGLELHQHGDYNLLNATAAVSAYLSMKSQLAGLFSQSYFQRVASYIRKRVGTFQGVKRRFDYITKRDDFVFIDDYAHHPKEMSSFFKAVRELFPDKRICAVFQPHLYSRTRDFADDFARALDLPDEVVLLPIYPAREKPISGITSEFLLSKIKNPHKSVLAKEDLFSYLQCNLPDVLLTVGAGDIDRLVPELAEL